MTVETRRESFVVHPGYGYSEDDEPTSVVTIDGRPEARASFCRRWRDDPHPEFLYGDLDDLVEVLTTLRDARRPMGAQNKREATKTLSAIELEALLWAVGQCPLEALRLAGVQGRFGDGVGEGALARATTKLQRRLSALFEDSEHEEGDVPERWGGWSDEEVRVLNTAMNESAQNYAELTDAAWTVLEEVKAEHVRRAEGREQPDGYRGPGVYESFTGLVYEVLGRVGTDGAVVLRKAELEDGMLYEENWSEFNAVREDGTPVWRWVRALGEGE